MLPNFAPSVGFIPEIFREWLLSREAESELAVFNPDHDEPPCLLDLIHCWIGADKHIIQIPSWGHFMAGVVAITGAWLDGDQTFIYEASDEDQNRAPLLRHPQTKVPTRVTRLLTVVDRFEWEARHPVLDPSTFEMCHAKALANLLLYPEEL